MYAHLSACIHLNMYTYIYVSMCVYTYLGMLGVTPILQDYLLENTDLGISGISQHNIFHIFKLSVWKVKTIKLR